MLVLSMNSKRHRRPNVRLGEIGDFSAAFACGFSNKIKGSLGHKRYKIDFLNPNETEHNPIYGYVEQTPEDPGVFPGISADLQQNRENKNPNSSNRIFELASLDEIDNTKSKLNFGVITRKCRVMKRRGRSAEGNNNVFGSLWSSKLSPQFNNEDEKDCGVKEFVGLALDACNDYCPDTGSKDSSDHETLAASKDVREYDIDEPAFDVIQPENFYDHWQDDDDVCYEGEDLSPVPGHAWDEMTRGGGDVNTVTRWLEERGFGKYAGMFEMHEVDEEALPLITLEDLKEMGIFAVGPRRKLYNAIQQLRRDASAR